MAFIPRQNTSDTLKARNDTKNRHYNVHIYRINPTRFISVAFKHWKRQLNSKIKFISLKFRIVAFNTKYSQNVHAFKIEIKVIKSFIMFNK